MAKIIYKWSIFQPAINFSKWGWEHFSQAALALKGARTHCPHRRCVGWVRRHLLFCGEPHNAQVFDGSQSKKQDISQLRMLYGLGFQHCIFSLRIIKDCPTWTPQILRTLNTRNEETSGDDMKILAAKKTFDLGKVTKPRFLSRSKG